jgi:hypothetical protein
LYAKLGARNVAPGSNTERRSRAKFDQRTATKGQIEQHTNTRRG